MYDSIAASGVKAGAFLDGVASARRQTVGSAAFDDADSRRMWTQSAVDGGKFDAPAGECVEAICRGDNDSGKTVDIRRTFVSGRAATTSALRSTPAVDDERAVGVCRSRPAVDLRHSSFCLETAIADQSLYSGDDDGTTACISDAAATAWNELIETSSNTQLLLSSCRYDVDDRSTAGPHHASTSMFWSYNGSPAVPPNYELFRGLPAPLDDSGRSCPSMSQRWSDSEIVTGNWLNANPNQHCAGFGSTDPSFLITSPL